MPVKSLSHIILLLLLLMLLFCVGKRVSPFVLLFLSGLSLSGCKLLSNVFLQHFRFSSVLGGDSKSHWSDLSPHTLFNAIRGSSALCVCVCVCVSLRERETQREKREREREKERERGSESIFGGLVQVLQPPSGLP